MKRMSAMVLSTICIMNALASPVATAFADTNGYEVVDLSANSDKLMGAGLAEEETASPSTIAEEGESSDELDNIDLDDLEQYRTYLNDEKTRFKNVYDREFTKDSDGKWYYAQPDDFSHGVYTEDMERRDDLSYLVWKYLGAGGSLEKYRKYDANREAFTDMNGNRVFKDASYPSGWRYYKLWSGQTDYSISDEAYEYVSGRLKQYEEHLRLKALEKDKETWSDAKKRYSSLSMVYKENRDTVESGYYALPDSDAMTLDSIDLRNYDTPSSVVTRLSVVDNNVDAIKAFINEKYPELEDVSNIIYSKPIGKGYGVTFSAKLEGNTENPVYFGKDRDSDGGWIDSESKKLWQFFLPLKTSNRDLIFADASFERRLKVAPDTEISKDDLKVILDYLRESRDLAKINVSDRMVKYDADGKYYYLDADYEFKGETDLIHGHIHLLNSYGVDHDAENYYVDFEEDKTELSDEDVARLNKSLEVMKNNIFYDFDIRVSDDRHITLDERRSFRTGGGSRILGANVKLSTTDAPEMLPVGKGSVCGLTGISYGIMNVPFRVDSSIYTMLDYSSFVDRDFNEMRIKGSMFSFDESDDAITLNDYVKARNGGFPVERFIKLDTRKFNNELGAPHLLACVYKDDTGKTKYYVLALRDNATTLYFREDGSRKPIVASEALRTKVKDVVEEKFGSFVKDVHVDSVIENGAIRFLFTASDTGEKVAGMVRLVADPSGLFPPVMCPPSLNYSTPLNLLVYSNVPGTNGPVGGTVVYDDDHYKPKKSDEPKSEEPTMPASPSELEKPSKPDTPVSPSEIEKPSEPDVPKNEEPAPSKPVVPVSPSEIEKPVNPPVTPDKPSVPVVPKPSVPDSVKPIEKATPSNITPSSDRPNRNDSVRPTPSKPSVPQGNDSVAITKVNESEELSKDKSVAGVDRLNGNVRGGFRNTPLQSDSKPVTIGNPISRNVRTGDMSLAIVFGALAMVNAFGLGFYFWKMNKQLED